MGESVLLLTSHGKESKMDTREAKSMEQNGAKTALEPANEAVRRSTRNEQVLKVKDALEAPDYNWRTVEGIAQDTGLDPATVKDAFKDLSSSLIRSSIPDKLGRPLYTTRDHYKKKQ